MPPQRPFMPKLPTDNSGSTDEDISIDPKLYYMPGVWYSFTLCPEDQEEKSADRWKILTSQIYETTLSAFAGYAQYRYTVEISEPRDRVPRNKIPRIHAHGRFVFESSKGIRQFLLFGLYNLTQLGICEIDTISDIPT